MKRLDQAQLEAAACRQSACVLAGAGSGKTMTLVEAITRRLSENSLDVQDILALTFTDKAAAELRRRLADSFAGRRREAEADGLTARADFWRAQAARLDRADIGTIHSFAFKLVRENAFRLGLPAAPELDPDETRLDRDLDDLFLDWLDKGCPELLRLLKYFSPKVLKELLAACAARQGSWGLSRLAPSTGATMEPAGLLDAFGRQVREAADLVRGGAIARGKNYYPTVMAALEGLENGFGPASPAGLKDRLPEFRALLQASGRWYTAHNLKIVLSQALTDLEAAVGQTLVQPLLEDLLALANQLPQALAKARARRGSINYDDILSLARRLLAAFPEVRETGRRRFIFIDEFQDTNRLQANLLAYLLLPPDDRSSYPEETDIWGRLDWAALESRFSAYGDLRQSIYRFRGAEVEVMAGLWEALAQGGGRVLDLRGNYRSQPSLVEFFNALFQDREFFQDRQEPVRPDLYEGPHVVRLHASASEAASVPGRAEEEARLLASYLARLFQGQYGVLVDDGAGGGRPPRPGDVAVLFRRFRYAPVFQKTLLAAGWPVRLVQDDSDYPERRGLLAAFSFLCGLDPELNLAAALRSPLGPVTDQALLDLVWPPDEPAAPIRLTEYFLGGRPWPPRLPPDDEEVLTQVRDLFVELAPLVGRIQPVKILERLVEGRHLIPLAALEPDGEARARALTGFLAQSRALGRPGEFRNPAEELAELGRNQGGRMENGHEAVTLSTVHAAKGLEFPVVVIAESDSPPKIPSPRLLIAGDGRLALNWRPSGWPTPPASYLELAEEEDRLEKMENRRLFYVAATRAKDHLVFLARPKLKDEKARGEADTWLKTLLNCPEAVDLSREFIEFPELPAPIPASRPRTDHREEALDLLAPMTPAGASLNATELARWLAGTKDEAGYEGHESSEAAPGSALTPRQAGLLFHAVMEIMDPREPCARELLSAEASRLGLSLGNPAPLAAPIEAFLKNSWGLAWLEATLAGRAVFREWPFQLRLRERGGQARHLKVNGVIDLFYQTPDGARLVDYKFAALPSESRALAVYENQVRLYALALTKAGFGDGLKAALYFAAKPHVHEIDLWTEEFWEDYFKKMIFETL